MLPLLLRSKLTAVYLFSVFVVPPLGGNDRKSILTNDLCILYEYIGFVAVRKELMCVAICAVRKDSMTQDKIHQVCDQCIFLSTCIIALTVPARKQECT